MHYLLSHQRLQNIAASFFIILVFAALYINIPYFQRYFAHQVYWRGSELSYLEILQTFTLIYAAILLVFYALERFPRPSKSIWCLQALWRVIQSPQRFWQEGWTKNERLGVLSILLKGFFAPLMVVWLFDHSLTLLNNGWVLLDTWKYSESSWRSLLGTEGYWFLFRLILFVDVFFFTIGYLVELPILKNEIRSVDPTILGWAVALACYPPFNGLTGSVFGWHSSDFPQFTNNPTIHLVANSLLLLLMAGYSWASIALNFKASNLTHRGIVSSGPYKFVRHPAYACKNLAWWIGLGPALILAAHNSLTAVLLTVGSMLGWSAIYYMRAVTEEDHLRSVDTGYDLYCKKVKYRFIPFIW